jgi:hypothetical protein
MVDTWIFWLDLFWRRVLDDGDKGSLMSKPEEPEYWRRDVGMPKAFRTAFWFLVGVLYGWVLWGHK